VSYNSAHFRRQIDKFIKLVHDREALLYKRVLKHVRKSILDGSPITGAPGQPQQSGDLYRSWMDEGSEEARYVKFISRLFYAKIIEDNFRGAQLRSKVGGFHSVKLTRNAFLAIVRYELAIVKRAVPGEYGWRDADTGRFVG
jgi:hypothetical protein